MFVPPRIHPSHPGLARRGETLMLHVETIYTGKPYGTTMNHGVFFFLFFFQVMISQKTRCSILFSLFSFRDSSTFAYPCIASSNLSLLLETTWTKHSIHSSHVCKQENKKKHHPPSFCSPKTHRRSLIFSFAAPSRFTRGRLPHQRSRDHRAERCPIAWSALGGWRRMEDGVRKMEDIEDMDTMDGCWGWRMEFG